MGQSHGHTLGVLGDNLQAVRHLAAIQGMIPGHDLLAPPELDGLGPAVHTARQRFGAAAEMVVDDLHAQAHAQHRDAGIQHRPVCAVFIRRTRARRDDQPMELSRIHLIQGIIHHQRGCLSGRESQQVLKIPGKTVVVVHKQNIHGRLSPEPAFILLRSEKVIVSFSGYPALSKPGKQTTATPMAQDTPPRVGIFLPKLSRYGGAEGFGLRLAEALARDGLAVDFICARAETQAPENVRVIRVGRYGLLKSLKMLWFALAAERIRRKNQYDISIGLGKTLNQDILRISGGPLKNFWELSKRAYPGGLPRRWKMLRRRLSPANFLTRRIEPRQLRNVKTIVAVSHNVLDWLARDFPWLDRSKVRLIYNRPDLERFTPCTPEERQELRARFGIQAEETTIGTAASNFALKGVATLIRSLPLLPDNHRLLVAGGRNPAKYLRLAESLGVRGRVTFLGRVEDMPSLYRALDVFALPSFYDACSNAVLEALACATPAVSSRDNGSSYFLPKEHVVRDPSDPQELAQAINRAQSAPKSKFSWPDDVAHGLEPYLELVRELLP